MSASSTPVFPRSLQVGLEETDLVLRRYADRPPEPWLMLDVGAHRGTSTIDFAKQGWRVHAFEPDPTNRSFFLRKLADFDNVTVDARAVSDADGQSVTLFDSEESSGISSLLAFTDSHRPAAEVETVTLETYIAASGIDRVDFLKVDTEGYDLMVLKGFPWDRFRPEFVLCEFEDRKTVHLGYTTGALVDYLRGLGYHLLVSEWHPIERYGVTHSFARLRRHDGRDPVPSSWGNILAARDETALSALLADAPDVLRVRAKEPPRTALARFRLWQRGVAIQRVVAEKRRDLASRRAS